jgi:hypothetical protein
MFHRLAELLSRKQALRQRQAARRTSRRRAARWQAALDFRPRFEPLEPRQMLAVATVAATNNTATEAGGSGLFTFSFDEADMTNDRMIKFTLSGSATPGNMTGDYAAPYESFGDGVYGVTMYMGTTSAYFYVTPHKDNLIEGNESVVVTLQSNTGYSVGSPSSDTVTIIDDPPRVWLTRSAASISEAGAPTATFTLHRSGGDLSAPLEVDLVLNGSAGQDDVYAIDTLTFGAAPQTFTMSATVSEYYFHVTPKVDNLVEGTETISLTLEPGDNYVIDTQAGDSVTLAIQDDPPVISIQTIEGSAWTNEEYPDREARFRFARSGGDLDAALNFGFHALTAGMLPGIQYVAASAFTVVDDYLSSLGENGAFSTLFLSSQTEVFANLLPVDAAAAAIGLMGLAVNRQHGPGHLPGARERGGRRGRNLRQRSSPPGIDL